MLEEEAIAEALKRTAPAQQTVQLVKEQINNTVEQLKQRIADTPDAQRNELAHVYAHVAGYGITVMCNLTNCHEALGAETTLQLLALMSMTPNYEQVSQYAAMLDSVSVSHSSLDEALSQMAQYWVDFSIY